jgi:hypothetical protein
VEVAVEQLVETAEHGGSGIVIVKQYQATPTYQVASGVWSLSMNNTISRNRERGHRVLHSM